MKDELISSNVVDDRPDTFSHYHTITTFLGGRVSMAITMLMEFPKWSRTFMEFSDFREFREFDKPLKHELSSM